MERDAWRSIGAAVLLVIAVALAACSPPPENQPPPDGSTVSESPPPPPPPPPPEPGAEGPLPEAPNQPARVGETPGDRDSGSPPGTAQPSPSPPVSAAPGPGGRASGSVGGVITRPPVNARSGQPPPGPPRNGGGRQAVPPPRPVDEPPTPAPDVRTRFDEVDAALEELVTGTVAFNTPERMRYGDAQTITLIASPKLDPDALGEELRERIGGGDPITVESLKIAPLMEAQLEGAPAFDVTALTPVRQPVGRSAPTVWEWRVLAHAAGVHTLHLTINAIVTVDGERFPRSLNVLDRRITVEISTGQRVAMFVGTNWQWFAGSIVIPLAVWLWTMSRSGKPKRRR